MTKNWNAHDFLTVSSEQSGAAEARLAHNPEVRRSKLPAKDQDRLTVFPNASVYLVTAQLGERSTEDLKVPGSIPGFSSLLTPNHIVENSLRYLCHCP